jgi:atlastin
LQFLIRDWQNFEDEENVDQCLSEMPGVLSHAIEREVADDGTREQIRASFSKLSCFLLPHPGKKLTNKNYDGAIGEIDEQFLGLLDVYVRGLFEDSLVSKNFNGRDVDIRDFSLYLRALVSVFKDGQLPRTMTLVQAISVTTNICSKDDAMEMYKKAMRKAMISGEYMPDQELTDFHKTHLAAALAWYDEKATFGEPESIAGMRKKLVEAIEEEHKHFNEINKHRMNSALQWLVVPMLVAVIAFVLDWISDWTCDAWSDHCVKFSRSAALFYYAVSALLAYNLYKIYTSNGPTMAWASALTLAKDTVETGGEYVHKAKESAGLVPPAKAKKE